MSSRRQFCPDPVVSRTGDIHLWFQIRAKTTGIGTVYTQISIIPAVKVIWFLVYISFYELTASNFEHILLVSHLFCTKIFNKNIAQLTKTALETHFQKPIASFTSHFNTMHWHLLFFQIICYEVRYQAHKYEKGSDLPCFCKAEKWSNMSHLAQSALGELFNSMLLKILFCRAIFEPAILMPKWHQINGNLLSSWHPDFYCHVRWKCFHLRFPDYCSHLDLALLSVLVIITTEGQWAGEDTYILTYLSILSVAYTRLLLWASPCVCSGATTEKKTQL